MLQMFLNDWIIASASRAGFSSTSALPPAASIFFVRRGGEPVSLHRQARPQLAVAQDLDRLAPLAEQPGRLRTSGFTIESAVKRVQALDVDRPVLDPEDVREARASGRAGGAASGRPRSPASRSSRCWTSGRSRRGRRSCRCRSPARDRRACGPSGSPAPDEARAASSSPRPAGTDHRPSSTITRWDTLAIMPRT